VLLKRYARDLAALMLRHPNQFTKFTADVRDYKRRRNADSIATM